MAPLIGSGMGIRFVREHIERATDFTVLIEGAPGAQPHLDSIDVGAEAAWERKHCKMAGQDRSQPLDAWRRASSSLAAYGYEICPHISLAPKMAVFADLNGPMRRFGHARTPFGPGSPSVGRSNWAWCFE
jgi:hypothetical protein